MPRPRRPTTSMAAPAEDDADDDEAESLVVEDDGAGQPPGTDAWRAALSSADVVNPWRQVEVSASQPQWCSVPPTETRPSQWAEQRCSLHGSLKVGPGVAGDAEVFGVDGECVGNAVGEVLGAPVVGAADGAVVGVVVGDVVGAPVGAAEVGAADGAEVVGGAAAMKSLTSATLALLQPLRRMALMLVQ